MYQFFSVLILIASVLLVIVVLIQKSKGGGLASNVSNYNQMLGVRKTTDFVEKATWGLAIFICVLSILSCILTSTRYITNGEKPTIENVPVQQQSTPFQTPDQGQ